MRIRDTKTFIEKAREVHRDKYDYSKAEYIDKATKICIICPEHGEFWQTAHQHVNLGCGCRKCADKKRAVPKITTEEWIERARKVHGDKYDYSKAEYVNQNEKLCIICPEHGEFWQTPTAHIFLKEGCPKCSGHYTMTTEEWIEKAREIHGDKYDYSKTEFTGANKKVCIICPKHGEFWQVAYSHLEGYGCKKCAISQLADKYRKTKEKFIEDARKIHGDKYDYSKVKYENTETKVCIICPKHGEFWQTPSKHLLGQGCPQCAIENRAISKNIGGKEFIRRAKELYGDDYIYDETEYVKMTDKVKIICKKHGEFWQRPYDHLNGHGCPKCGMIESRGENEIYDFVCSLLGKKNVEQSNRTVLDGYEIDIYVPSLKIGIEYNGLKWHSDKFRNRNYHINKTIKANENGVRLIQIFEDEYLHSKEIVLSKIRSLLHCNGNLPITMARKCSVLEIEKEIAKSFIDENHIQGYKGCSIALGCFDENNKLVGVMTFERNENEWVLNRFATDIHRRCVGIGGKLFHYFVKNYDPNIVRSYADLRWTVDKDVNLYTKIGFKLEEILKPEYRYVNESHPSERIHKFNFRKNLLEKRYGIDSKLTESQMAKELGYYKIWDCGMLKYIYKKENANN